MKTLAFIIGLTVLSTMNAASQCVVHLLIDSIEKDQVEICLGDSLQLVAEGEYILMNDNFNVQFYGPHWTSFPALVEYQNPCGLGVGGSTYVWFGEYVPPQRIIETVDFNLTAGGYVSFDFKYGVQGLPTPCDGPDEQKEGVALQYSTNQGATWTDITYFAPDGTFLPSNPGVSWPSTSGFTQFTSWDNYKFPLPPGAQTATTRFRWIQEYANYYNGHYDDNWGIDNVIVSRSIQFETIWSQGDTVLNPPAVHPVNDSLFVVHILNYADPTDTLASDSLLVIVHQTPVFSFITDTTRICEGDTLGVSVTGNFNYHWSHGALGPAVVVQPSENTTYHVTSTDNLGCFYEDSINIIVEDLPEILSFGDTICFGQNAYIMSTGGVDYIWNTGDSTAQIIVNPNASSLYTVTVTGSNACINYDSVYVVVHTLPDVRLTGDTTICYGTKAKLNVSGGSEYFWSTGESTGSITVQPYDHTRYTVLVKDIHNCMAVDSVMVYVNPFNDFNVSAAADSICLGSTVALSASGALYYQWSTGDVAPDIEVFPYTPTTYFVTASDIFNGLECFIEKSYGIHVSECNTLHLANAFAPKGYNTIYKPIGIFSNILDYEFSIFDRWGKMVFTTNDPEEGWDGRVRGEYVSTGVYVFRISYTTAFINKRFERIGSVTVIE